MACWRTVPLGFLAVDTYPVLPNAVDALKQRLFWLWERTGEATLHRVAQGQHPFTGEALHAGHHNYLDWVSTALMDAYRNGGDSAVFAELFELNRLWVEHAVQSRLRRVASRVDAQDVVQEVFLNIFRYPHRFHADRADAFKGWAHRIAHNTLIKFAKGQSRFSCVAESDEIAEQAEDTHTRQPDLAAEDAEGAVVANCAYLLYLQLYLRHFAELSVKERFALTQVEVEGVPYRDVAAAMGIRLENLKMVIFRGRRKILRGMAESLATMAQAAQAHARAELLRRQSCPKNVGRDGTRTPARDLDVAYH